MIALIEIKNTQDQGVDISTSDNVQKIDIENELDQEIDIKEQSDVQSIEIVQTECAYNIDILPCPLQIEIDNKVPKALSILSPIASEQFETSDKRKLVRVYVDANGTPHYMTLEQLKELNTKTVFVETLAEEKIETLSNGDIIMLEER